MASQVEICRLALAHIADAARVTSIDPADNSIQAQHCATFYPIARDKLLAAADWTFARRRVALDESLVEFEDGEWAYAYSLPADFIRAIKVLPPGAPMDLPGTEYYIESDLSELDTLLLSNVEDAVLHYIYREEETGRYTPSCITALSLLLGSYLAGPIVKGKAGIALKQALYNAYVIELAVAEAEDGKGQRVDKQYAGHRPIWVSDR